MSRPPQTNRQARATKYNFLLKRLSSLRGITPGDLPYCSFGTAAAFEEVNRAVETAMKAVKHDHMAASQGDNPKTYPMGRQKENF